MDEKLHQAPHATRERRGFLALPHAMREAVRPLAPIQRLILYELAAEAEWEPVSKPVHGFGYSVQLDAGEVLCSSRLFAERHGLGKGDKGRSAVRRALAAGIRAKVIETRSAEPPGGPPPGPRCGPRGDPPPTVVRFARWRGILWPSTEEADPPPGQPDNVAGALANHGTPNPLTPLQPAACSPLQLTNVSEGERRRNVVLAPEVRRVKRAIEGKIGGKLPVARDRAGRAYAGAVFSDWIAQEGEAHVVNACVQLAYDMAEKEGNTPGSLLYLAQAWERISDGYVPGQTRPRPGHLQTPGTRWANLLGHMTPAQLAAWTLENNSLHARKRDGNPPADAEWSAFYERWAAVVLPKRASGA